MNYRHAFHAGNFADCMKHALLVWLIEAMCRKPAPFFALDTHAGVGHYDLDAVPANRTMEAHTGILRLLDSSADSSLASYVALVRRLGLYPGSPSLIEALMRPDDRLACCELHDEDVRDLRGLFALNPAVSVHHRDAWEALRGLLPPKQKRGLILIDPPFEDPEEFANLAAGLKLGHSRFPTGGFAAWYPVTQLARVRQFLDTMRGSGIRDIVTAEFLLREPLDPSRLNGCGLLVINPPYRFEVEAPVILDALLSAIGTGEPGQGTSVVRLCDE